MKEILKLVTVVCAMKVITSVKTTAKLPQFPQYGKSLILAGGAVEDNNADIFGRVVAMAGGKGIAKLGIINAASADPADSYNYYHDLFTKTFLLAGNVPSPALQAIKDRWDLGAVVAGSSAGTACLSSAVMVTGGVSWNALTYGAHETSSDRNVLTYRQHGGIGIYDGYILDTHFGSRGREGRLIRLLSDTQHLPHGVLYGIGVDPNTALVVTEAGTSNERGEVVGTHGVSLVDVSKSYVDPFHTYFDIRNVYMSYLTAGDTISLVSHNVSVSSTKTLLTGNESHTHAVTSSDIFYGESSPTKKTEFLRVAASIVDARKDLYSYGDTNEKHPRFRVTMSKTGTHTESWVERRGTFNSDIISYKNMYLEINAN